MIDHNPVSLMVLCIRAIRLPRVLHYAAMATIGFLVATLDITTPFLDFHHRLHLTVQHLPSLLLAAVAMGSAFLTLNIVNNTWDLRAGMEKWEVLESYRLVSDHRWRLIGWVLLAISFIAAMLTGEIPVLMYLGAYYLIGMVYIVPPVRLKRWYPISTFLLALAACCSLMAGFHAVPESDRLGELPVRLIACILITFTIAFGTKDRKDLQRDVKGGIKTLYTVWGMTGGRYVNAGLVLLSYCLVPLILGWNELFLLAIPFGTLSALVVASPDEHYREGHIFLLYFVFALGAAVAFAFHFELL